MNAKFQAARLASIFLLAISSSAYAQQPQADGPPPPAQEQLAPAVGGTVHTADGSAVPGAAVRLANTATNKAWVTWTDESGKFQFPPLPQGMYHVEISQLGFVPSALDLELVGPPAPVIAVTLRVATLADLAPKQQPSPPRQNAGGNPNSGEPRRGRSGPPGAGGAPGENGAGQGGGRGQVPAGVANALRQGLGGFQQTELSGEPGAQTDETVATQGNGAPSTPAFALSSGGSSSDSFLLQGTTGQGLSPNGPGGQGEFGSLFPGSPGGPGGPGGRGGGPGQGFGGPGGGQMPGGFGRGGGFGGGPGGGGGGGGGGRLARQAVNRLRFSLYDHYENSIWDARPYSINGIERPKVSHYDERFGGNVGGPLAIPHIYNGKDRTYFFVNYQHETAQNGVNTYSTVPTMDERTGNFCNDIPTLQLFNPTSSFTGPRTLLNPASPCQINSMLTPLDKAATALLNSIPPPNLPGTVQNFLLQSTTPLNSDSVNLHVLHTINSKFNLNGGYNLNSQRQNTLGNFFSTAGTQSTLNQNVDLGLSHNWTSKLVEDTHLNWSRSRVRTLSDNSFNPAFDEFTAFGINGVSQAPLNFGLPALSFTSFGSLNDPLPSLVRNQTLRASDSLTWVHGTHTMKFGGEVRRIQLNADSSPVPRGQFVFTGLLTSNLDASGNPVPGTGNDFADFLLGLPYSTRVQFGPDTYLRSWDFIAYAQDDWHMNKRFTFDYGIRYEAVTPPIEINNNIANLAFNAALTKATILTPGTAGFPRALVHGDYDNWAPRIGFAWQPFDIKPKTVIRGGYSIFYNVSSYNSLAQQYLTFEPPSSTSQNVITSAAQLLTIENGFPASDLITNKGGIEPNYRDAYAQIWMFGTETSFTQNWILDLTYTGTKGTFLDFLRAPNRAPLGTPASETQQMLSITNADSFYFDQSGANSIYNALQVRVVHRFTHGISIQGVYTFSKSLDNASSIGGGTPVVVQQDGVQVAGQPPPAPNFAAERGLSAFDMRHQLRLFSVYELPFGARHRYANHGWAQHVFGEWRLLDILTWHTGTPATALLGGSISDNGTGASFSLRPNLIANPNLGICGGPALAYFNVNAFATPAPNEYGDEHRGSIEGPCSFVWNLSLAKTFRFGPQERHRLEARWEVQNLLNNGNFSGLATTLGSTSFGRVTSAASMRTMDVMFRFNF